MISPKRIQYLAEDDLPVPGVALRSGRAGWVYAGPDDGFISDVRLEISANSTHALIGHGVVDALNQLPLEGRVGFGLEVLIPPPQLEPARLLFYQADAKTYGRQHEFVLGTQSSGFANESLNPAHQVEYRIRIDNREYQHTLSGLQYLLRTASHEGMAAWLMI